MNDENSKKYTNENIEVSSCLWKKGVMAISYTNPISRTMQSNGTPTLEFRQALNKLSDIVSRIVDIDVKRLNIQGVETGEEQDGGTWYRISLEFDGTNGYTFQIKTPKLHLCHIDFEEHEDPSLANFIDEDDYRLEHPTQLYYGEEDLFDKVFYCAERYITGERDTSTCQPDLFEGEGVVVTPPDKGKQRQLPGAVRLLEAHAEEIQDDGGESDEQ